MKLAPLEYNILTSPQAVEALEAEWRALHARVGHTIFTDYDWFHIWWRTIGNTKGRRLHIITGHRDGKLVALLALVVVRRKGFRVLQGIGEEAFYQHDMLCEDGDQALAMWHIVRNSPHYDFAHIRDISPGSACIEPLSRFASLYDKNKEINLRLSWRSGKEWKAGLSKQLRRNLDKALRKLEAQGTVAYEVCHSMPLPERVIEDMVTHKAAWCIEYGHLGMFDQPNILAFYQQMAEEAAQRGSLVLAWLKCGETTIAYHLSFRYGKTLYSYAMAVDPAWLQYSPGHLAHVNAIAWAIDNGFDLFNHMQGDFAYKYQFSNEIRECIEYSFSHSFRGWIGRHLFIRRRAVKRYLYSKRKAWEKRRRCGA